MYTNVPLIVNINLILYHTAIRLQSGSTIDTAVQADYLAVAPGKALVGYRMYRIIIQILVQISCVKLK